MPTNNWRIEVTVEEARRYAAQLGSPADSPQPAPTTEAPQPAPVENQESRSPRGLWRGWEYQVLPGGSGSSSVIRFRKIGGQIRNGFLGQRLRSFWLIVAEFNLNGDRFDLRSGRNMILIPPELLDHFRRYLEGDWGFLSANGNSPISTDGDLQRSSGDPVSSSRCLRNVPGHRVFYWIGTGYNQIRVYLEPEEVWSRTPILNRDPYHAGLPSLRAELLRLNYRQESDVDGAPYYVHVGPWDDPMTAGDAAREMEGLGLVQDASFTDYMETRTASWETDDGRISYSIRRNDNGRTLIFLVPYGPRSLSSLTSTGGEAMRNLYRRGYHLTTSPGHIFSPNRDRDGISIEEIQRDMEELGFVRDQGSDLHMPTRLDQSGHRIFYYIARSDSPESGVFVSIEPECHWNQEHCLIDHYDYHGSREVIASLTRLGYLEVEESTFQNENRRTVGEVRRDMESLGFFRNEDFDNFMEDHRADD